MATEGCGISGRIVSAAINPTQPLSPGAANRQETGGKPAPPEEGQNLPQDVLPVVQVWRQLSPAVRA